MIIDFDRYQKIAWYLYSFAMVLLIGLELQVPGAVTLKALPLGTGSQASEIFSLLKL